MDELIARQITRCRNRLAFSFNHLRINIMEGRVLHTEELDSVEVFSVVHEVIDRVPDPVRIRRFVGPTWTS